MSITEVRDADPKAAVADAYQSLKRRYLESQKRYVRLEDLERTGDAAAIEELRGWGEIPSAGLVSIVIPVLDQPELTKSCLAAIRAHTGLPLEILLVDNGSGTATRAAIDELAAANPRIHVIRNELNEGFAFACNQGIAAASGEWIVLLNNDVAVTDRWLARLLAFASLDPAIGLVGPRTNRASGPQQVDDARYGDLAEMERYAQRLAERRAGEFSLHTRLVGLCLLVSRRVVETIGGLDPCFFPGNFEDDDFCLRAVRAGFQPAVVDDVFVHHAQSATFRAQGMDYGRTLHDNWTWFCAKHDYAGDYGPYPARHLALKRGFDRGTDHVPVRSEDVFHPEAEPLPLDGARGTRVLLFADGERGAWAEKLREYVTTIDAAADVTLVLRIDPPTAGNVEVVVERVRAILAATGKADADLPDVLAETTPLPASMRGSLYTASHSLWLAGSPRDRVYRREAEACGIEVTTERMDSVAAASRR